MNLIIMVIILLDCSAVSLLFRSLMAVLIRLSALHLPLSSATKRVMSVSAIAGADRAKALEEASKRGELCEES